MNLIPVDVRLLIFSYLTLKERCLAREVCKEWKTWSERSFPENIHLYLNTCIKSKITSRFKSSFFQKKTEEGFHVSSFKFPLAVGTGYQSIRCYDVMKKVFVHHTLHKMYPKEILFYDGLTSIFTESQGVIKFNLQTNRLIFKLELPKNSKQLGLKGENLYFYDLSRIAVMNISSGSIQILYESKEKIQIAFRKKKVICLETTSGISVLNLHDKSQKSISSHGLSGMSQSINKKIYFYQISFEEKKITAFDCQDLQEYKNYYYNTVFHGFSNRKVQAIIPSTNFLIIQMIHCSCPQQKNLISTIEIIDNNAGTTLTLFKLAHEITNLSYNHFTFVIRIKHLERKSLGLSEDRLKIWNFAANPAAEQGFCSIS